VAPVTREGRGNARELLTCGRQSRQEWGISSYRPLLGQRLHRVKKHPDFADSGSQRIALD